MRFVRLEPFVVPKSSLTGVNTERVDTRVVQVVYSLDPALPAVLQGKIPVGQMLDVFIDVKPKAALTEKVPWNLPESRFESPYARSQLLPTRNSTGRGVPLKHNSQSQRFNQQV